MITTEREWRWFLIPHRPSLSVCGIEVWDSEGWLWKVKEIAPGPGCMPTPFAYGEKLGRLDVEVPAKPLRRGRSYSIYVAGEFRLEVKSFAVNSEGKLRWLPDEQMNPPPDSTGPR
ncbi:hypothetical protein GGQ97_001487 [Sphingomonas kaistensis]|uniref:Uncharacterized protein n=1 Tax=Sphingomonas kaistensis TaxID=298708 RepID=A0A7X6BFS0_9SPHN|nr:hypothetical protein [Sphingomonas kaistensis]NJC05694.1 hypothetical protein [Sphingomonas kaistensis]